MNKKEYTKEDIFDIVDRITINILYSGGFNNITVKQIKDCMEDILIKYDILSEYKGYMSLLGSKQ